MVSSGQISYTLSYIVVYCLVFVIVRLPFCHCTCILQRTSFCFTLCIYSLVHLEFCYCHVHLEFFLLSCAFGICYCHVHLVYVIAMCNLLLRRAGIHVLAAWWWIYRTHFNTLANIATNLQFNSTLSQYILHNRLSTQLLCACMHFSTCVLSDPQAINKKSSTYMYFKFWTGIYGICARKSSFTVIITVLDLLPCTF